MNIQFPFEMRSMTHANHDRRSPDSLTNGISIPEKTDLMSAPALNGHATTQLPVTNGTTSPQIKTSTPPAELNGLKEPEEVTQKRGS